MNLYKNGDKYILADDMAGAIYLSADNKDYNVKPLIENLKCKNPRVISENEANRIMMLPQVDR